MSRLELLRFAASKMNVASPERAHPPTPAEEIVQGIASAFKRLSAAEQAKVIAALEAMASSV